ncbi:nuclear transport factor 2 family protein [Mycolicibacter kumamotonensis]|uniref:nuclear transport factor 2 family protein n=1 Tax=Mycolicibacter kumamotonensis TaxID=354243 RepID=UPI000A01EC33|nr:nuclear transport factor 2 family protein [Mycolicibacter kumamotonensis]
MTANKPADSGDARRIGLAFFAALRERRFNDAFSLLDDDGTHWGGSFPYREHPLAGFKAKLRMVEQGIHDTPMDFTVVNCIGEGDQVVLELRNEGKLVDGRPYEMVYCFILRVGDGRIISMREYADTAYSRDIRPELYSKQSPVYRGLNEQGLTASTFDDLD